MLVRSKCMVTILEEIHRRMYNVLQEDERGVSIMEESFVANDQATIFDIEGQLAEEDAHFLEELLNVNPALRSSKQIGMPFTTKSHVSIGTPDRPTPLGELFKESGKPLPVDIKRQMKLYEFYRVRLTCSFIAGTGCRFHDARFALDLHTIPANPNPSAQAITDYAIAYDLFPLRVEDEYKVNIKRGITPQFSSTSNPASPAISLFHYEGTEEYITYKGHIEAFDMQGTHPAWSFARTPTHEIAGSYELFLFIRKPKGTLVKATLSLTVHVQFMVGKIALDPLPLVLLFRRGRDNPVLVDTPTVPLC
jgi:hypothetical protein